MMNIQWPRDFVPSTQTSAGIRIIRPVLILFMTLAHIGILDQVSRMVNVSVLDFENWFMVFLKAGIAKSGVPLLSLISGYLAVATLQRYGYGSVLWRKAKRLIWPLFWSNLLFILLITYPEQARDPNVRPDLAIHPFNLLGWFQATFAFYRLPANQPLYFLKDLYTCFLLLPLLMLMARVKYFNIAVLFWMAYKCIYLKTGFIFEFFPLGFIRFDIVFAFYVGILLNFWKKDLVIQNRKINLALVGLFLGACGLASVAYVLLAKADHLALFLWTDFIVKVCSVAGCVAIMSLLALNRGWLAGFLERMSPYSYTLFLTHLFVFTFFHRIYLRFFPSPDFFHLSGILYIVLMLLSAVVVAVLLKNLWSRVWAAIRPGPGSTAPR